MLYSLFVDSYKTHEQTLWGECRVFNVKPGGTNCNHQALKGVHSFRSRSGQEGTSAKTELAVSKHTRGITPCSHQEFTVTDKMYVTDSSTCSRNRIWIIKFNLIFIFFNEGNGKQKLSCRTTHKKQNKIRTLIKVLRILSICLGLILDCDAMTVKIIFGK